MKITFKYCRNINPDVYMSFLILNFKTKSNESKN